MTKLTELTIEIVQRCPNRCLYCSSLAGPKAEGIIKREVILDVARQAKELGLETISLSGGEPLLYPELVDLVKELASIDLHVNLYTTGIKMDLGQAVACTDWSFLPRGESTIIFSLQSADPTLHDSLVSRIGAFDLTHQALLSAISQGYDVETHIVPNRLNLHSLDATVRAAISWGVHRVSFLRLVPQGYACLNIDKLKLSDEDDSTLRQVVQTLASDDEVRSKVRFGIPFSGTLSMPKKCTAAEAKLIVRYDGKILPCEAFKDERFTCMVLGDVHDTSLWDALWNGKVNEALQRAKGYAGGCESCPAQLLYSLNCFDGDFDRHC